MKTKIKFTTFLNIILLFLFVYVSIYFVTEGKKIGSYQSEIQYYEARIESLKDTQKDLLAKKENINSPEYIEEMAREKLDMYYPNETVYIDVSK